MLEVFGDSEDRFSPDFELAGLRLGHNLLWLRTRQTRLAEDNVVRGGETGDTLSNRSK